MKEYLVTFAVVAVALCFALISTTVLSAITGWHSAAFDLIAVPAWVAGSVVLAKRFGAATLILVQVAALIISWGALI